MNQPASNHQQSRATLLHTASMDAFIKKRASIEISQPILGNKHEAHRRANVATATPQSKRPLPIRGANNK